VPLLPERPRRVVFVLRLVLLRLVRLADFLLARLVLRLAERLVLVFLVAFLEALRVPRMPQRQGLRLGVMRSGR
jgi:hypothetical protein